MANLDGPILFFPETFLETNEKGLIYCGIDCD